jgi:hypothetical protein
MRECIGLTNGYKKGERRKLHAWCDERWVISPFSLSEPVVERRAFERRAEREILKMNAWASAIHGKKLSGERIANLEKMSECPALHMCTICTMCSAHVLSLTWVNSCWEFQYVPKIVLLFCLKFEWVKNVWARTVSAYLWRLVRRLGLPERWQRLPTPKTEQNLNKVICFYAWPLADPTKWDKLK